ncbi:MAG: ABC transporter permease [Spirochaetales bacterium]|nr:ABC transporter permease [Spirochaetales bacterium]
MNIGEDVRMSLRSIRKRPVESLLLIFGIALGIGATAAGISLISYSVKAKNDLLSQVPYREVVVRVRESAEDMDLPAAPQISDGSAFISSRDLVAKDDVPDVEYAYVADRMELRVMTQAMIAQFENRQLQDGGGAAPAGDGFMMMGPPPDEGAPPSEDRSAGAGEGAAARGNEREGPAAPPVGEDFFSGILESLDGPQPVIEQMPGMRVSLEYFSAWNLNVSEGSLFTAGEIEQNAQVMVLGSELAATLFEDDASLGREVLIMRNLYKIVGILETTGTSIDGTAFIPQQYIDIDRIPQFARQFIGRGTALHFTVYDPDRLDEAKSQLAEWFSQNYGEGQVVITVPRVEVEAAQDRTARLVSVILFLAVAGLLIASVNVSNILLGRAMRKRKNVGILKALGASIKDVFGLFFIEALILGVSGALLGTAISLLISKLMLLAISGGAVVSAMLFLGILAAWAITTSLTVIPALQASRIPAADALRYE